MLFITKNAMIKLVKKNTIDSWQESGRNHAVSLIRQVQLPHKRTKTELGKELCIFCGERDSTGNLCAAEELHSGSNTNNQHVQKLTESWSVMALTIDDLDVHAKL